jgi:mono/diheme cytochrome c family protein
MKPILAALALAAVLTDAAVAGCPVVRRNAVVVEAAIVTPAVVATFVPVTVAAYSAAYVPPATTDPALLKAIADLGGRLDRIEANCKAPAQSPAQPPALPMPRADLEPGAVRFMANCARCHDAAAPKGGLTLFRNNAPADLSCEQALACINALSEGRMPKASKLAVDEDGPEIVAWLSRRARK